MITTNTNQNPSGNISPEASSFPSVNQQNSVALKAMSNPVDLHAEISTLKSARQTDAYLLSLREREILELKNLLQCKASTDFNQISTSLQLQSKQGFHSLNNDSTDTLVFSESRDGTDLDPILDDVTKIVDSPIVGPRHQPKVAANDSRLLSTLPFESHSFLCSSSSFEAKRNNGIRFGTLDHDQYQCQPTELPDSAESAFTESDLQCFRSLAIHERGFAGAGDVSDSSAIDNLQLQNIQNKASPLFQTSPLEARGPSPVIKSGPATRCSSTSELATNNIWAQYPGYSLTSSLKSAPKEFAHTEMYRQASLQPARGTRNDFPSDDPRAMNRAFADHENASRYKFNLDPTSPAYVPSNTNQFRPQSRVQSVPAYGSRDSEKGVWGAISTSRQPSQTFYADFDDMVGDSALYGEHDTSGSRSYSSRDTNVTANQALQHGYTASGLISGTPELDEFPVNHDFNEFGDSIHYQLLVEKIIQTNDQPASLHLQQNIKHLSGLIQSPSTEATTVASAIRSRNLLMESVRPQALSLMRNRFGNFLMQRCLEFGTRDQVKNIVSLMVGHVYPLSCDRFGCHVVQKALDVCEDDIKFNIVSELFRAIPETITHRFACHVWQRVFETKWGAPLNPQSPTALEQFPLTANMPDTTSPAQVQITFANRSKIVQRVDAALKGQWHLVANDENGSLVVQCIFENCTDADKREIIKEVLVFAADIAKGQWGNWVIQHLLDHGTPGDKSHIFKVVARNVYSMSVDQFASKVVEKVLKSCQRRELFDIVDVVISPVMRENCCPGILEMMNNQYANYVVQHILTLSDPSQRDTCVRLIAPHLPVLRGSKYGQRVAAIVEKHIRTCQQRFGTIINVPINSNTINSLNHFTRSSSNSSAYNNGNNSNNVSNQIGEDDRYNLQSNVYGNFSTPPSNPLFNSTYPPNNSGGSFEGPPNYFNSHQQQTQIYATSPNFQESQLLGQMNVNYQQQQQQQPQQQNNGLKHGFNIPTYYPPSALGDEQFNGQW
ncbi:armadillo-type protein [Obelidium mucronatum]|nr:armadillo-type protein [Obelidium mucronatum]